MPNNERNPFPTALVVVLLVLIAAIAIGGIAVAGAVHDSPWHSDAVDNGTRHGGMMDGRDGEGLNWVIVPVALGVLLVIVLLWLLRPSQGPERQAPAYQPPAQQVPAQQPMPPQPYPLQPPARPPAPQQSPRKDVPIDILEERLAKGELSEEDYLSVLETLKKGRSG